MWKANAYPNLRSKLLLRVDGDVAGNAEAVVPSPRASRDRGISIWSNSEKIAALRGPLFSPLPRTFFATSHILPHVSRQPQLDIPMPKVMKISSEEIYGRLVDQALPRSFR